MALSPLQDATTKWRQRQAVAQSYGLHPSQIQPLMQYDLQRIAKGSSPMTNEEVQTALQSQLFGTNVVQQQPKTGLSHVLGNISSDIYQNVMGFIPGAIHFAEHLPSEVGQLGQDLSHPTLHGITHDPILSLIPGVYDVGQLATPQGRQWLETHPVSSLLDVLPLAGSAGKAAMAGRAVEAGSAAEALARGSVVKAGIRAGTDTLSSAAEKLVKRPIDIRKSFDQHLMNLGLHGSIRENIARPVAQMTRRAQAEVHATWTHKIDPLIKNLSQEERNQLFFDATIRGGISSNPRHQFILDAVREFNQQLYVRGSERKALYGFEVPGGHQAVYDYKHPAAVAHRKFVKAKDAVETARRQVVKARDPEVIGRRIDELVRRRKVADDREADFNSILATSPDASFHPAIVDAIRGKVADEVRQGNVLASAQITHDVYQRIADTPSEKWLASLIGKKEYEAIRQSSVKMWLDMAKSGMSPIWVKKASTDQMERAMFPRPLVENKLSPTQYRRVVLNFAPGIEDIAAGVTAAESELVRETLTTAVLNHVLENFGKPTEDVRQHYERFLADSGRMKHRLATQPRMEYIRSHMEREWEPLDPNDFGVKKTSVHRSDDILVPKGVMRSLRIMRGGYRLFGQDYQGGLFGVHGAYDKALHVFRLSVLTGPRHFIHVSMGGLAFMALRHPQALSKIATAWTDFNSGRVPNELRGDVTAFSADQVYNYKAGQQMASLWGRIARKGGNLHDAYVRFEQKVGSVQRAAVHLSLVDKIGHEAALNEAYKTFVDIDGMAPIERAIMKQVIPFYPFMRHLFRYLFQLPVDHPYRVGILSRFAQQEQQEWDTRLPEMYQSYLFLGEPDANGNVHSIDIKNLNPFRSFYNDFTLAGFVSAANPFFTGFAQAAGLNILSASPQLYTDWTVNPQTGGKQTSRPQNAVLSLVEQFIPETQAADAFLGLSNKFRSIRQSDPQAFYHDLYNYLNLPFAGALPGTGKLNIPLTEERSEITQYQAAQNALTKALDTGDWSQAEQFDYVPYNGQLVSRPALQQYLSYLQGILGQYGITNPKSVLQPPIKPTIPFHL